MSEDSPGGDTPLKPERTPMKPGIRSLRAAAAMGAAGSPLAGLSTPQHKPAAGLGATGALAHRHELAVSAAQSPAGTPHTPAQASPHVQAAFKEIVASPSPKVSMLVERLKQKEAKHVEAIVVERDREQKRAAMLAEAQKVRAARKKAAVESEANYAKAEELRAEADSELARQRQKSEAARHNYHELVAKRDGSSTSASHGANQIEEQALIAAEKKHKQRVKEAERARAAMTAARAEHDKALRMEQAFLDVQSEKGSGPYPPESQRSEELFTALSPPQSSDVSSPLSGLQVMSPLSANASLPLASPCEAAAEEERLAWWAMEEYEAVMEEERKRDEAERREKMKRLEAAEEARREEERKQREERVRHERETKQRALELEIQARRDREREEFERQERERAEAEERELKKRQEAERREMEQREQQRLLFEQQRQEEERQERLERERKTKEVQDCGRAMIAQLMSSVRSRNLSGAQEALKALHKFHVVESIFVTDEQRVEEQQASGAVHVLESQHAEMYHERILLIERGEADLEAASTALKSEDLSTARDLVRSSLERLKEAAVPCVFEDIWRDLEQRIEGDVEQAQALLQEVVVRDDCISNAEQHVQDSRARLAAGDWMAARALLQEARKELRRAQMSRHDAQLKALTAEIDAAEQLQLERNAEEERRRDMVNNGETQLASACAAMSEGDIPKARALLREARVNFEQAEASKELFDEIASMQQRVDEAEDLLRRKAAIEQERHRNLSQGQLKLQECRRALDTLEEAESEGSIIEAKALLQAAKEAFWRANNHAMDAQVGLLERAIEAAELREQQQLEVRQRAAAQVRAAEEHWRRAVKEMASNGNVEEVEHLLRSARAALAALHDIPNGIDVAGLQMRLDEAEDELVVVREMRVGEDYLRQSQEALARGDLEAVELSLAQARAAFGRYGEDHPLALNGLSACRTVQANVERSRRRKEQQKQAALDEIAGDEALEEARIVWEDARDAQRAAALFTKASEFYKKSGNFNKEDAVIQAEARFREEEEEERRVKEREEAFRAEQLLEADGMVARAKMLVEGEMLEDARQLLARAADAYRLSGLGEPAEAFLEVEGFLNFAEQERAHKEEEAKARREHFRRQGDAHLSKAREVLDSGSNDFDQARGYAKEAGGLYREGGWVKMEQQVLDTIQLISDREDVVVRQLMEADRLQREKKLEEQARKRELDALILQKQMQESAESAAAEAEARRRAAAEEEALLEAERLARESRRKQEELDAVQREVARRKSEETARMDRLAKSAQGLVETAMLAVETGDWDVARGKIREAREMLARAGLQDSVGTSSGSLQSDSSSKIMHLSDMVKSVSEQLEAAAESSQRNELVERVRTAQRDAEAAMARGEWTGARKLLADANDAALQLPDKDLQEDIQRMRRAVDVAQDQSDAAAREMPPPPAQASQEPVVTDAQATRAVRAAPPLPPRPVPGQDMAAGMQHDQDLYPLPMPPGADNLPGVGGDVVGRRKSSAAMHGPGRPLLSDESNGASAQEEHEPNASSNADGSWGMRDPILDVPNQVDGIIKVSMLASDRRMPSDNISHWTELSDAPPGHDLDLLDAEQSMEDITGGILGGAMSGLASLTDNSRRSNAFLLSANSSLSQKDLTCILDFSKRAKISGTYDSEGDDGLMAMLERGDQRLVNAYRGYEFHRDDATFIDELEEIRRQGRTSASFARRLL